MFGISIMQEHELYLKIDIVSYIYNFILEIKTLLKNACARQNSFLQFNKSLTDF